MKKVKVGVVGVGRGQTMIQYCETSSHAEVVAICDKWEEGLARCKKKHGDAVTYYTSYDEFLNHDMDVVVLANYANEHAPFAIKAMNHGKHVISEVLPVQTLKEAVELVETVERTGLHYCYLENYCYMPAPREMKRLYQEGALGEFEYGEGEYIHNCESIWPQITYGEENHWRNNMYATCYCTHSAGPIIHITGLRPVKVTGFELPFNALCAREGHKGGSAGIMMVTLENGAIFKSIDMQLYKNSIWYSIYGSKGRMESAREDAEQGDVARIYTNLDKIAGDYFTEGNSKLESYKPEESASEAEQFGHGGSDYYSMWNAIESILGNEKADPIDVYEALDMFLPGMFAYFSVLEGGIPMEVPNFRDPAVREKYRNDTRCTDPKVAGDQLIPSYSKGNPEIPQSTYDEIRTRWEKHLETSED